MAALARGRGRRSGGRRGGARPPRGRLFPLGATLALLGLTALATGGCASGETTPAPDPLGEVDTSDEHLGDEGDEGGAAVAQGQSVAFGTGGPRVLGAEAMHAYLFEGPLPWVPGGYRAYGGQAAGAVAGMYNTGTNVAWMIMNRNCQAEGQANSNPEQYRESLSSMGKEQRHLLTDGALRWQMRAGKHVAPSYQLSDVAPEEFRNDWVDWWKRTNFEADETPFETLPLVVTRHPLTWLWKSMCRKHYGAYTAKNEPGFVDHTDTSCTNQIARNPVHRRVERHSSAPECEWAFTKEEIRKARSPLFQPTSCRFVMRYRDPLELYSDWYRSYVELFNAPGPPVVFVRQEDILLHPYETVAKLCWAFRNVTLKQEDFQPLERNIKARKNGERVKGHQPILDAEGKAVTAGAEVDASYEQAETVCAASSLTPRAAALLFLSSSLTPLFAGYYKSKVLDPLYIFSDEQGAPLPRERIDEARGIINATLLELFGYSLDVPPEISVPAQQAP